MIDAPGATQIDSQDTIAAAQGAPGQHQSHPLPEVDDESFVIDWRRILINCFIAFHLFAVCLWNLPMSQVRQVALGYVTPYMMFSGNWQYWGMFSPKPSDTNIYLSAVVHYQNGSQKTVVFPRMSKLGWVSRYRWERWRKFGENVFPNTSSNQWPFLARYAAISNNPDPYTNPPVSVALTRTWTFIPAPGYRALPYTSYNFSQQFLSHSFLEKGSGR